MWSILVITCIIFQSSVAIFLLNRMRTDRDNDFNKYLRTLLLILTAHLSVKFLLLAVLKDMFLYAEVPSGFSFAYGPLLLIIARKALNRRRMPPLIVFYHFQPFLIFSIVYMMLVIAGATGSIPRSVISGYAAWYQWLAVLSLYGYPLYIKSKLRRADKIRSDSALECQLVSRIANVLLLGISMAFLVFTITREVNELDGFDLRLLPYMCFAAIPILILRYRMAKGEEKRTDTMAAAIPETHAAKVVIDKIPVMELSASQPVGKTSPAEEENVAAEVEIADRRYEKSGINEAQMNEYETALTAFMKKSRIYLDPDLSLEQLAAGMKMPKHHLTQLLNERMMKSYYNYINEYRINEAIDRLNNPSATVNMLSLAFDCGFNSRSSFNNHFKKITGSTPSAYRKLAPQSAGRLNISPSK